MAEPFHDALLYPAMEFRLRHRGRVARIRVSGQQEVDCPALRLELARSGDELGDALVPQQPSRQQHAQRRSIFAHAFARSEARAIHARTCDQPHLRRVHQPGALEQRDIFRVLQDQARTAPAQRQPQQHAHHWAQQARPHVVTGENVAHARNRIHPHRDTRQPRS